jgi:hypothetical protein
MEKSEYTRPILEVIGELHDVTAGLNVNISGDFLLGGSSATCGSC